MMTRFVACIFCLLFTCNTWAVNRQVNIIKVEKEVSNDSTLSLGADLDSLYGNKKNNKQFGGDEDKYFKKHQIDPNKDVQGISVYRDSSSCVKLRISIDSLTKDTSIIKLKKAYWAGPKPNEGWCASDNDVYEVRIIKKKVVAEPSVIQSENDTTQTKKNDDSSEEDSEFSYLDYLPYVLIVLLLLFVIYLHQEIIRLHKIIKDVDNQIKEEKDKKLLYRINELTQKISDLNKPVGNQINQQPKEKKETTNVQQVSIPQTKIEVITPKIVEDIKFDTTDVMYNPDNNSFQVKDNPKSLFRIYSVNGNYYYTIINDKDAEEALATQLPLHGNCLQYESNNNVAVSRVSPVKPGKLFKDSDTYFRVDENNKLQVKLLDR